MIDELSDHLKQGGFLLTAIKKGKFNHMKKLALILLVVPTLSGCASLLKGYHENIYVSTSTGKQADAIITTSSGEQKITLPQIVPVKTSNADITVSVKETSCNNASTKIVASEVHPLFFGNFIFGGLLGSTTDAVTGSMWTYDENVIVDVFEKDNCKSSK